MNRFTLYDVPNEGRGCLGRDVWVFAYFEGRGLVLDYYAHEERDSLRHKFRARSAYHRLSHDRSIDVPTVSEDKVPLPEWVKERAKELFFASVKVGKWGEE